MTKFEHSEVYKGLSRIMSKLRGEGVGTVLVRGASTSFFISILSTGISFGTQIFLARAMGEKQYGIYIYALTWINVLLLLAKMGLDTLLLRYVAAYNAQRQWGVLRGLLQSSDRFALLGSGIVSSVTVLGVWALQKQIGTDLTYTFWVACASLPLMTIMQLRLSALQSLKQIALAQLPEQVLRPLLLCILVGILIVGFSLPINSITVMLINSTLTGVFLGISAYSLNRILPKPVKLSSPRYQNREWLSVALAMFMISGTYLIFTQIDIFMIGAMLGTTEAGIYTVASRLTTLMLLGLTAINTIAAPMISQLFASGKQTELQRMVTLGAWGNFAFSLPVAGLLIFGGNIFLSLFGRAFSEGYLVLVILVLGQLVSALAGLTGCLITMTGHQKEAALIVGSSATLNVILNAILIPSLGINGAAIATASTTFIWNIVMFVYIQNQLRINSTIFSWK